MSYLSLLFASCRVLIFRLQDAAVDLVFPAATLKAQLVRDDEHSTGDLLHLTFTAT